MYVIIYMWQLQHFHKANIHTQVIKKMEKLIQRFCFEKHLTKIKNQAWLFILSILNIKD